MASARGHRALPEESRGNRAATSPRQRFARCDRQASRNGAGDGSDRHRLTERGRHCDNYGCRRSSWSPAFNARASRCRCVPARKLTMSAGLPDLVPAPAPSSLEAAVSGKSSVNVNAKKRRWTLPTSPLLPIAALFVGGVALFFFNVPLIAQALWTLGLIGAGFPVVWRTLRAARRGNYATDVVASLS